MDDYHVARRRAQEAANADGYDRGLEYNPVFGTWRSFMLPRRENRCGRERTCEVVSSERLDLCAPGHGPCG
jgi:hypothetical protein